MALRKTSRDVWRISDIGTGRLFGAWVYVGRRETRVNLWDGADL